jgi:phage tail sheath protein FI
MAAQLSPGINVSEFDLTTSVPTVSTSVGGIAGLFSSGPINQPVFIDSESKLASVFGGPTDNNYETWFTAANFLGYGNKLYVTRINGSLTGNNAVANVGTVATYPSVNNMAAYNTLLAANTTSPFNSANVDWVAKSVGTIGNSLRISVCDKQSQYSSSLYANGKTSALNLDVGVNFSMDVGSNTMAIVATPGVGNTVTDANTYLTSIAANVNIGDIITVGNTAIGKQNIKVLSVGSVTANSSAAAANITFTTAYRLSTAFSTTNTVNNTVTRKWEFSTVIGVQPLQTDFVKRFGNTSAIDGIHVVIVDEKGKVSGTPGAVLESYSNLSRATDAKDATGADNYYASVINKKSNYVYWGSDRTGAPSANALLVASSTNTAPSNVNFAGGTDSATESTVSMQGLMNGYDTFKSPENIDLSLLLQGKPTGGVNTYELANYLIDIAESRKDCVAFISPPDSVVTSNPGTEAQSIANWGDSVTGSSYAVVDSGYKYMYDKYNDKYRYVPLNGDVAGLCVRTDTTRDSWWSPAGFNRGQIKNIVQLRYNPTQGDRDVLYPKSINPVVTFPGQGTILYGDKTHQFLPSAFDHINVRRLFIVLEKAISRASKAFLFEFNDDFTRAQFKALVNPYLRDVQGRRGITDFLVVCDSSNNTAEVIDRGEFIGDIYIKPARSINYIQLNFVAVRTGVQFSEIVGKFG